MHAAALQSSLRSAKVEWIDTSPNYGDGAAEELIGEVLKEAPERAAPVKLCSKFGYIEGAALERHKSSPFEQVAEFTDSCFYSLHSGKRRT